MEKSDKKKREAEYTQKYTMTPQDFKRMIAEKMERARAYSNALKKTQETFLKGRWLQSVIGNEDLVCTLNMDKRAVARMAYLLVDKKIRHSKAYRVKTLWCVLLYTFSGVCQEPVPYGGL